MEPENGFERATLARHSRSTRLRTMLVKLGQFTSEAICDVRDLLCSTSGSRPLSLLIPPKILMMLSTTADVIFRMTAVESIVSI